MKQLVCLADRPWSRVPARTQQLMTRMKDVQILYLEPPIRRKRPWKDEGRRMRSDLLVYSLPPILDPEENSRLLFRMGQRKLSRYIERIMGRHGFRDPVLWCATPSAVHLLDALPFRGLIYDCGRDWSALPDDWESDLCLEADVVFAASPELVDHLSPCNDNVVLLPNGANWSIFSREDLSVPPELQDIQGPIVGYEGTVWHDLDLGPLLRAARDYPRVHFVLIGRVEENPALRALHALPNVRLLGWRPLMELPAYLARFDVGVSLLRRDSLDTDVLPPRIFEYFSAGKPVVSMLLPGQVEQFPDVIYSAHSAHEFSQLCGSALAEAGTWARDRRRAYGEAASWSNRAREVEQILGGIGMF